MHPIGEIMNNSILGPLIVTLSLFTIAAAPAADNMTGMKMDNGTSQGLGPASQAYLHTMANMHEKMAVGVKAKDPDIAFAQGMIPHHQGAIAMARVELQYGKDPAMRQLAENIIKAQKTEIRMMHDWLKAHPHNGH